MAGLLLEVGDDVALAPSGQGTAGAAVWQAAIVCGGVLLWCLCQVGG